MPVLVFASEPLYKPDSSRTSIAVSDVTSRALIDLLEGRPLTSFTTAHLGPILALADAQSKDSSLHRLVDAIVQHKQVYVRFA
jgi:hypothetical protein